MKITDGLLGEHALFYALFDSVERVLADAQSVTEIRHAFEVIAEGIVSHANLEEELLFPALDAQGPLRVMRAEHQEIEELVQAIAGAKSREDARDIGTRLLDVLREHFHKEEAVLFPMCETRVGEQTLIALGERYRARRKIP